MLSNTKVSEASDHALSFTVVLASGQHVTADASTNPDLFWALKGGGAGAFGIVTSLTVKTFKTIPVTGMSLHITGEGDKFWEGVDIWYNMAQAYTEVSEIPLLIV
jgi:hypothetical protein